MSRQNARWVGAFNLIHALRLTFWAVMCSGGDGGMGHAQTITTGQSWPQDCGGSEPVGICGCYRYCRKHGGTGKPFNEVRFDTEPRLGAHGAAIVKRREAARQREEVSR